MADDSSNAKRKSIRGRDRGKRKRSKNSSPVNLVLGDEQCLKLKIDKKLLEEFKLAGRTEFPNSLLSYVDNHDGLLDEIFSIFTKDDIKGLLPDTLKGFKMKKIKTLCRHQLSLLDKAALERIIKGEQDAMLQTSEEKDNIHGISSHTEDVDCQTKTFSDVSDNEAEQSAPLSVMESKRVSSRHETSKSGASMEFCSAHTELTVDVSVENHEDAIAIAPPILDEVDIELSGTSGIEKGCSSVSRGRKRKKRKEDTSCDKGDGHAHTKSKSVSVALCESPSTVESVLREKLLRKAESQHLFPKKGEERTVLPSKETPTNLELEMKEKALRSLLMKTVKKVQQT
jgi:hypothetical protein